jgi:secondary thiamine-phosphate synthase enzyme
MIVESQQIVLQTTENTDIIDITSLATVFVSRSGAQGGALILFTPGSTAALTTIEYESGVINDLRAAIERLAPERLPYEHNERWGDGNGYSHVRSALLGPSLHVPLIDGKLALGTWQQIVLLDFDNRARQRHVIMQIMGVS